MSWLRGKILFGLIAYFGGFATAIYYLAPVSQDAAGKKQRQSAMWNASEKTGLNSEKCKEMAGQLGQKMRSAVAFAEEQAKRIAELYKAHTAQAGQNDKDLRAAAN